MSSPRKPVEELVEPDQGIDLEPQHDFQRREWRWQRAGWITAGVLLLVAVLGLFGNGPLSWASAASDDGALSVDYQRFVRHMGMDQAELRVAAEAVPDDGVVRLVIGEWAESLDILQITPQPSTSWTRGQDLVLEFETEPGRELVVQLEYRAASTWLLGGTVTVEPGGASVEVTQFSYP